LSPRYDISAYDVALQYNYLREPSGTSGKLPEPALAAPDRRGERLMFCPECGFNAGDAKFCPECGTNLATLRTHRIGTAEVDDDAGHASPRSEDAHQALTPGEEMHRDSRQLRRSSSPKLIWVGAAVLLVAVVAAVFIMSDLGSSPAGTPTASATATAPANPDLSGTYSDLVTRASGYYEQGAPYVSSGNFTAAAPWFAAAAKVLQAAWNKQPGDPGVGTDLANSLFYAGNIQGAITQIDLVLKKSPKDQAALLDKGNFVNMAGQMDKQAGQTAHANAEIAEAKQLYQQAIKIDPTSANGKAAATQLKSL
jgi:tetratricopeptide (TPR) repeat protein